MEYFDKNNENNSDNTSFLSSIFTNYTTAENKNKISGQLPENMDFVNILNGTTRVWPNKKNGRSTWYFLHNISRDILQ